MVQQSFLKKEPVRLQIDGVFGTFTSKIKASCQYLKKEKEGASCQRTGIIEADYMVPLSSFECYSFLFKHAATC